MKTIDVKKLIEDKNLDVKEVANQLFPGNKYPRLALNRVIAGESTLDSNQISKLSLFAGVQIQELFEGAGWKIETTKNIHVFKNGEYLAKLDTDTWITRLFHNESMFHETIINSGSTVLSQYLTEINLLITKYEQNDKSRN